MLIANVICGPCKALSVYILRRMTWITHERPSEFESAFLALLFDLAGVCEVITGVILITSVLAIHSFFKENDAADRVDTQALLRHASCYVLYLISTIGFFGMYTL
jgi:hypothetical protein